jgi:multidrug efflux pump subunit AcrB
VELDPQRLAADAVDPIAVRQSIRAANVRADADGPIADGAIAAVRAGTRLENVDELRAVVVGAHAGRAVLLRDVADVVDGDARPSTDVTFHTRDGAHAAVTVAVAKRKGTNAIDVARRIEEKLDVLRGAVIPTDVRMTITRNYGETAAEKSNELLWHMLLAVLSVSALIWLALGRREALVVLIAIPVTLALTLFTFYLYGYTLNRITLFALIFSIGILVDDAIVVVENVVRHARLKTGEPGGLTALAIQAVDEVGNPTILATLTVIAAILPMAFVGGLMGPYMRPIPVGASAAMVFSLVVAFIVTPWAAVRLLRPSGGHGTDGDDRLTRLYRRVMRPLLREPRVRALFLGGVVALLLAAAALVPLQLVRVKMLPFDNKSEFQVMVDLPEGAPLEQTARVTSALARAALTDPLVRDVQSYSGTSAPYNFNGLVRHYFLRQGPAVADVQVNLRSRDERKAQSHEVAVRLRPLVDEVARRYGASAKVAEIPPGPPVLATLTAEVYGPTAEARRAAATAVRGVFDSVPGVVDVDWSLRAEHPELRLSAVPDAAALAGLTPAEMARAMTAVGGVPAGTLHDPRAADPVDIVVRYAAADRAGSEAVRNLRLPTRAGTLVPATSVALLEEQAAPQPVYRKDLKPVVYVTGDVARELESPAYAMLAMEDRLAAAGIPTTWAGPAELTEQVSLNWDGEWRITYEVFRDLGIAFAAVLVLIYLLVVAWFQSYLTPLVIMAPIPLTLAGILPAHWLSGAFFTATSMIGMIALAGIIVRNSILLVDFIELARARGTAVSEAVVEAGLVRARPILLTAAAVVVGGVVMVGDPIFQGLGIAMISGALVATLLTLVVIPLLYADLVGGSRPTGGATL